MANPPVENEDNFHIPPDVQKQLDAIIANDPKAAEAFRQTFAAMRQAAHAVQAGQYADFGEAMEAITGRRPTRVDLDDQDQEVPE